jgi:hypothetical protein
MEEDVCCICLEDMEEDILKLSCNHTYHYDCVIKMFHRGFTRCAMCRREINIEALDTNCFFVIILTQPLTYQEKYILSFVCLYVLGSILFMMYIHYNSKTLNVHYNGTYYYSNQL